tara:strand:+ start:25126 stop:25344 length:219 start_codon:yes stop_codon:yes gene_type:complete
VSAVDEYVAEYYGAMQRRDSFQGMTKKAVKAELEQALIAHGNLISYLEGAASTAAAFGVSSKFVNKIIKDSR